MKWLEIEIIIDTSSIDLASLIFSLLSLFCGIITILIYLKLKSLRTIIYRAFFHIAINETISRIAHIIEYFLNNENNNVFFLFYVCVFLIYLTDTNILFLNSFSCYIMYQLIINPTKKINNRFKRFMTILYSISGIISVIFCIFSFHQNDIYSNIIALNFINDSNKNQDNLFPFLMTIIVYFVLIAYSTFKIIMITIFIRNKDNPDKGEIDDYNLQPKKQQKLFQLKSFQSKLRQYPMLDFYFYLPLCVYSFYEYFSKPEEKEADQIKDLNRKFLFYNINIFMNSIRGWMYFRLFISNEKIKMFLFKRFLRSSVFYSIEKINLRRERNPTCVTKNSIDLDENLDFNEKDLQKNERKYNSINTNNSNEKSNEKYIELYEKDSSFIENNIRVLSLQDDEEDEDVVNSINDVNNDSKSENTPKRKKKRNY
jgi:hypothetical protein